MALVGNMIAEAVGGNPSIVNYVMFVAVFGMLSLFYLIAATIVEAFAISPWFVLAADALNTLFFLVGGIALAADLGVHSCGNKVCEKRRWLTLDGLMQDARATSHRTVPSMDQSTKEKDVMRRKLLLRSYGSDSLRSLHRWPSQL